MASVNHVTMLGQYKVLKKDGTTGKLVPSGPFYFYLKEVKYYESI